MVTTIPRWTLAPRPGLATYSATIPAQLVATLDRRAAGWGVPLSAVLLAAHATVLAALCGEREVTTGYVAEAGGPPLPCPLAVEHRSWRALVPAASRTAAGMRGAPEPAARSFETVLDPSGHSDALGEDVVLRIGFSRQDGRLSVALRYRTDVLDADAAARIACYHRTALALIAADPDGEPRGQPAVGGRAAIPDRRARRAEPGAAGPARSTSCSRSGSRTHPDAVAAVHGDRQWTYRELNDRANRLGAGPAGPRAAPRGRRRGGRPSATWTGWPR